MLSSTNIKFLAAALGLLGLAFGVWWVTASYKDAVWQEKLTALENGALQTALDKEREAREKADELEVRFHDQTQSINLLAADNRRLADELDGLRDPYAAAGGGPGNAAGNSQDRPAAGKLSREASQFLLEFAEEADRVSAYAWTCYRWINRNAPGAIETPSSPTINTIK